AFILSCLACSSHQRYHHFQTNTPLADRDLLVIGFPGGRVRWDDRRDGVRRLALELRAAHVPRLHVETVENRNRGLALQLVKNAFDKNSDGVLSEGEKSSARLILYGQSFGGAAVIKFAHQLNDLKIPVILTVQIDSVGRGDAVIPENVRNAANLFQRKGKIIRGEPQIRAQNSESTKIIGNFEYKYSKKDIDLSGMPWHKKIFRTDHSKMNLDPRVWNHVKDLVLQHTTI
ncbi:MAG: hypothetical protein ACRD4B_09635, partial [Acidobacteriota bacterium]